VLSSGEDVTERRRAEAAVRELNEALERRVSERTALLETSNRDLEAFSYSVSHDLRAPLRAIDGFSKILIEDYSASLDSEGRRILGVIINGVENMSKLIDDLLAFSRTSRLEMTMADLDTEALAKDVTQSVLERNPGRKIDFRAGPLPRVRGDAPTLRQVFVNLIENAVKFTGKKDTAVIEIGCVSGERENEFYVKDNGVGFDMKYAGKLFGVFQRLHSVSEFEGTGVGLAIVGRIISRHGGRVWAESKPGEGAVFHFTLPV
jgi:light-regulated signal transduction histidine kinase (bacteriophytochrome)